MTFETYLLLKLVLAAVGVFVALPLCLLWLKYRDKKRSKE